MRHLKRERERERKEIDRERRHSKYTILVAPSKCATVIQGTLKKSIFNYDTVPVLVMKELRGLAVEVAMLAELVDIHANSMLPLPLPGDGNACTNVIYDYIFRHDYNIMTLF